jgi:hypothetical protein
MTPEAPNNCEVTHPPQPYYLVESSEVDGQIILSIAFPLSTLSSCINPHDRFPEEIYRAYEYRNKPCSVSEETEMDQNDPAIPKYFDVLIPTTSKPATRENQHIQQIAAKSEYFKLAGKITIGINILNGKLFIKSVKRYPPKDASNAPDHPAI